MKKILLLTILAISINAAAQSRRQTIETQHPSCHPAGNFQPGMKETRQNSLIQVNDSIYKWRWDTLSLGWTIAAKVVDIDYDPHKNLTNDLTRTWNGSTWENFGKYTATYDAANNLTSELNQSWNGTSWVYTWKYTYGYDTANNLINNSGQSWNGTAWENAWQSIFTYDTSNHLTSNLSQNWGSAGGWENSSLYTYLYDAGNNLMKDLGQNWNGTIWENYIQFTYAYAGNNQTGYYSELWNGSSWDNFSFCTYTYDANNNRTSGTVQYWDGIAWINTWHFNDYYDASNNLTLESGQLWNGSDWVNSWQCNYTYDTNNLTKSDSYLQWEITGTVITSGDSTWYYIDKTVGITELIARTEYPVVHPNPNAGKFTITCNNDADVLEIYTLSGQLVFYDSNIKQQKSDEIDISRLGKGIYIAKIHAGTKNYTEKILVQ